MLNAILNLLLPPLCLHCHEPVSENQTLCGACWKAVHFIAKPCCACCGAPFEVPVEEGTLCGGCLANPPIFAKARSAMIYDDASKNLVLGFKHGDRLHTAPALANWMQTAGKEILAEASLIIPVPLHRWRLFLRRYNQAAILAQVLGKAVNKPVVLEALQRIRATPSQGKMKRSEREKNVKGAFRVNPSRAKKIENQNVLLIDDVLTTGATANECARVLLASGAARVNILTLMRARPLLQ